MTQLGADPDHLRGLALTLRSAAGQLDALSTGLARRLRELDWRGPDAVAARHLWESRLGPQLRAAADGLLDLARRVRLHADEQQHASGADVGAATTRPLPAPARVEDRIVGGLDVRIGPVSTGVSGDLTIAEVSDDRRRITLSQVVAGGGVLAFGSTADVAFGGTSGAGAATNGVSAEARARAGVVVRRTWEVAEDRVDDLLVRLALDEAGQAVIGTSDVVGRVVGAADTLAKWLTGEDPAWDVAVGALTSVPTPATSERLAQVDLSGAAGAGWGGSLGLGARAAGATALRVGRSDAAERQSTVVELESSGSAAVTSTLLRRLGISLPMEADAAVTMRLELPDGLGDGGDRTAVARISATSDGRIDEVRALLHFDGPSGRSAADSLAAVLRDVGDGDVAHVLSRLDAAAVQPTRVQVQSSTAVLSGGSARAGLGAGLGLGAGASARGQVLHLERSGAA